MADKTIPSAPLNRPAAASLQLVCPSCEEESIYPIAGVEERGGPLHCPQCRLGFDLGWDSGEEEKGAPLKPDAHLVRCRVCGSREFYVQKDFNRQLGFTIALASLLVIFLIMLIWGHRVGIYCLFALALVDWLIYVMLPEVTVCYLCQSVYRGFPRNPEHKVFDLGQEEKYKRLRGGWARTLSKET